MTNRTSYVERFGPKNGDKDIALRKRSSRLNVTARGALLSQSCAITIITVTQDVANLSRSPFTDEIKKTEPPRKFNLPHFTSFRGGEDPDKHLMHYRSAMTLYTNNDAFMCKIFATTLQGEAQVWFYTLPPCLIRNFSEFSLVFTKEYLSYRLIKKKFDHLFNMKKDLKESLRSFVKRFKVEKAKIVRCDDNIACSTFRKGLPADHQLFGELIIARTCPWQTLMLCKPGDKRRDRSPAKGGTAPKTYTKFLVPISQILRDLKDKPWFKPPPPLRGDISKMDQTKYYAFHRGPGYTSNDYTIWKRVMVDNGSSVNLLQLSVIQKMGLENTIKRKIEVLIGFNGLTSTTIGTITLDVTSPLIVSSQTFMIVSDPFSHKGILSRPWLVKIGAVTSIEYQKI
ncbi:uncharacterized protein LOC125476679 [Pyrus x bretschneideri]|uniref:uncharacterized protein LOC125476679 n=1 Tax=Pyrus x bretschneideri TaxID=225117 RepID=UPI00202F3CA5|nr:uncharacterized protein LOC125476679 [Pyrus x bretschneideri]